MPRQLHKIEQFHGGLNTNSDARDILPNEISEANDVNVSDLGKIREHEGGMRVDIFDHDENSEYDFSENDCALCELPEHAQNHIIDDMEYEEGNA